MYHARGVCVVAYVVADPSTARTFVRAIDWASGFISFLSKKAEGV